MKKMAFTHLCILIFIVQNVFAQTTNNFKSQVDSLNYFLEKYDTIYVREIDPEDYDILENTYFEIVNRLVEVLEHPEMNNHHPAELIANKGLSINKSADGRLTAFSIDQKTGGSYHPYQTYLYYNIENLHIGVMDVGEAYVGSINIVEENSTYLYFHHLFTCTTCVQEGAVLVSFDSSGVNLIDVYSYDGRVGSEYNYDTESKIFTYQYETEFWEEDHYDEEKPNDFQRYTIKGKLEWKDNGFVEVETTSTIID